MIFDTSYIIDLMNSLPEAIEKLKQITESKENQFITTPTIFELWSGVMQSRKPEQEKRKILEVLESQLILDLDNSCAEEAGKMHGFLAKEGIFIDPADCMIAGIAKIHDEKVLTRNTKHFEKISAITIETY